MAARHVLIIAFALSLWDSAVISQCLLCRWERKAPRCRRSVCATTSPCTGAPSLWCPTTWTYLARQLCLPPCRRTTWCWRCCAPFSGFTWSPCCGPATLTAGHAQRSVGRVYYYQLWPCTTFSSQNNSRTLNYIPNINKEPSFQSEEDDSAGGQSRRCSVQLSDQCPNWPSQERRDYCQCKSLFVFQLRNNSFHFLPARRFRWKYHMKADGSIIGVL